MPDEENTTPAATDYSAFVPDTFKAEDGSYDTAKFRASYDELAAFRGQEDERVAAMPKDASGYVFSIPEGHKFPEGFNADLMKAKDEAGNEVAFDINSMIDANDPDLPALQAAMLSHKAAPGLMGEIASILANRELRSVMAAQAEAGEQKKLLGPQADARISTVQRSLTARLPKDQVDAVMDGITSAAALKAFESLLKSAAPATAPAPGGQDYSAMSAKDRIMAGMQQREGRA
jgi:hypothetical protein